MNETERGATRVNNAVEELARLVAILETKLVSVIRPLGPEKPLNEPEPEASTAIGKFLQQTGIKVERANRNIAQTIDRLEV